MANDYDNSLDDKAMRDRFAPPLTPAQHRAQAEANLDALRGLTAGAPAWHGHAQAAIAHVLAAVAAYLEPPPAPDIPGLPEGWRVTTAQSEKGAQLWRYELTGPGLETEFSQYCYGSSGSALVAGLKYAGTVPEPVQEPQGSAYDHSIGRHENCKHTREGSS